MSGVATQFTGPCSAVPQITACKVLLRIIGSIVWEGRAIGFVPISCRLPSAGYYDIIGCQLQKKVVKTTCSELWLYCLDLVMVPQNLLNSEHQNKTLLREP